MSHPACVEGSVNAYIYTIYRNKNHLICFFRYKFKKDDDLDSEEAVDLNTIDSSLFWNLYNVFILFLLHLKFCIMIIYSNQVILHIRFAYVIIYCNLGLLYVLHISFLIVTIRFSYIFIYSNLITLNVCFAIMIIYGSLCILYECFTYMIIFCNLFVCLRVIKLKYIFRVLQIYFLLVCKLVQGNTFSNK